MSIGTVGPGGTPVGPGTGGGVGPGPTPGAATTEEWSLKRRRGLRKYTCGFCDKQYWEDQVVVQNGAVRCQGQGTCNCVDQPGYRAEMRKLRLPIEVPNRPLPVIDEDL
ncbi:MAG TPA: hypothetical protein VNS88_10905 [Nitrospiraceae bacterium]|nr:hypothetical protein [Nitrospiraceae bacterium]